MEWWPPGARMHLPLMENVPLVAQIGLPNLVNVDLRVSVRERCQKLKFFFR
jgi:hypothetical protein